MITDLPAQRVGELLDVEAQDPFVREAGVDRARMGDFHQSPGDDNTIEAAESSCDLAGIALL